MLVLTRKVNEVIEIGDNITITVVKLDGRNISLGIDAPKDVPIWRGEIKGTLEKPDENEPIVVDK